MSILYKKLLNLMQSKNINKNYLRKKGVHSSTVDKLIKNNIVDTPTISKLCKLLNCQPGDIMEYVDAQIT